MRLCSYLVAVLLVSTALMVTTMMLVSDVKVCIVCNIWYYCYVTKYILIVTVDSVGSNCTYGDVRLVDGSNQYEGRLEVCINDQWGTVCDNSWSTTDASTICKQLEYAYTSSMIQLYHLHGYQKLTVCHFFSWKTIL